mgnify:CR=1 FL=1
MTEKRKFYGMRNDYMFHAVLQKNEEVLRNLLATLLEMDEADIVSCRIENPIELGREIKGKECILDAKIILNDARIINIELQVYKQTYWVNRSLLYWSRAYDSIKSGQEYDRLLPTYHIGILDFTLFNEHPKFMAQYQILDVEDHFLYSDKLCIKVLDLTQIEKAKKQPGTDKKLLKWASIFKAETLEELEGGGDLNMQYTPQGDMSLTGRYTLSGGVMKYSLPIIPLKEFQFNPGSYVDWRGNIMNPTLSLKATERMRASVADGDGDGSRMVNFDVSISIKNRLDAPDLIFDISAPEDAAVENELQAMGAEERSKQAIAMLATGIYLNSGAKGGGLSMGAALNSVLQSQINSLAGGIKGANISVGVEDRTSAETGDTQKDFSFRYSQRFFNDRVQIVIGGKVSTGANATNDAESFIDNISLEYRLDASGTRYVRVFHNKNYESILDGEITETGVGLVLRRKMDRLSELFIFRKKKIKPEAENSDMKK